MAAAKLEKTETKSKKGIPTPIKVGLGCLILLMVFVVLGSILGMTVAKKLIGGAIERKTGLKTNVEDISKGKITLTDPKTGAKIDVGTNEIPASFPKDFPVYPNAKVVSSLAGNGDANGSGFWLTLSTPDSVDTISKYYIDNLTKNGWKYETTQGAAGQNWTVSKGDLAGYLSIDKSQEGSDTAILIILGEDN